MRLFKLLLVVMSCGILFLSGCGGGASDSSGTLSLTATAPPDSTQPGSAVAKYTAANGQNPNGLEISFATDSNIIALDSTKQRVGSDGTATVTFRALPVPTDTTVKITASTGGLSQFQLITIKATSGAAPVTPPSVSTVPNSISFLSAQPTTITLKGMGGAGLVESSIVSFVVKDVANNPTPNQTIDFSLNTSVGGLLITPTSGVSDASGIVRTIVNAGTIATPVRVTATVRGSNPLISVQSDQLVVSTGIPSQDGFSTSSAILRVEGWDFDGVTDKINILMSDHFHNPVPDGTAVSFTTSCGQIQSSCTSTGGGCSVTWTSALPRINKGKCTILAYAVGEEDFLDSNGNGLADGVCTATGDGTGLPSVRVCGEFNDYSEAFRDDNWDGVRDVGPTGVLETFIDFNGDGIFNGPDGLFTGILQGAQTLNAGRPGGAPKTKHIFRNHHIIMSGSTANTLSFSGTAINPANLVCSDLTCTSTTVQPVSTTVVLTVKDINGNPMPAGTTIATTGLSASPASFAVADGIPSSSPNGFDTFGITLTAPTTGGSAPVTVTVTTPRGNKTTSTFNFSW